MSDLAFREGTKAPTQRGGQPLLNKLGIGVLVMLHRSGAETVKSREYAGSNLQSRRGLSRASPEGGSTPTLFVLAFLSY